MGVIELYKVDGVWLADFVGDAEIKRLFGQTALPTPFTTVTDFKVVQAKIQALNPDKLVYVKGESCNN